MTRRHVLPEGFVAAAYRFELDPNHLQRGQLASHCGAARYAYNFGLALVRDRLEARRVLEVLALRQGARLEDARSFATELVGPICWNLYALRRAWNEVKAEVAPWWAENSKEAYSSGLANLAAALSAYFSSREGTRAGQRVG